ncbi:MAG TPA: hypothetical protein VFF02_19390 [Anaeromyxobacteraceae bacterium]|nr:hypothetical protein [Anaeromyxobacteraceae bacterium]
MAAPSHWQESIGIGFQVFAQGGAEEFGAVRDVCPGGRQELLVNVENGGDHCIPLEAIVDVHDGKVVVDVARLPAVLQGTISRAHDAEVPGL